MAQQASNLSADEAEKRLKEFVSRESKGDADAFFMKGILNRKTGRNGNAAAAFVSSMSASDKLERDSLLGVTEILRDSGNLALEKVLLRELVYSESKDVFTSPISERLLENLFESGDYERALGFISDAPTYLSDDGENRRIKLVEVRALLKVGKKPSALEKLRTIAFETDNERRPDDYSLAAVRLLDELTEAEDSEEIKKRAFIYQFNRDFAGARKHYRKLTSEEDSDLSSEAFYQIGRGHVQLREFDEAKKAYENIVNKLPNSKFYNPAVYGLAGTHASLDETAAAIKFYTQYIEQNPKARNLIRAYLNIVDANRDAGDNRSALEWSRRAQIEFEGKPEWKPAVFSEALIHKTKDDASALVRTLSKYDEKDVSPNYNKAGGTNLPEVKFLIAKATGGSSVSVDAEERSSAARTYYAERLAENAETFTPLTTRNSGVFFTKVSALSKSERTKSLLNIGAIQLAAPLLETELSESSYPTSIASLGESKALRFAELYVDAGIADRGIRFIEPKRKNELKKGIDNFSAREFRLLYPVPFRKELLESSKKHGVDPRFLLSIMRQESRFQAEVKSIAAARGLMQFIGSTSNKIAEELKLEGFKQSQLYDPAVAIEFGAKYVSNLFKMFPNQPQAVAASYNGGEDRVERWIKRSGSNDPDDYVPEIVFHQTKDYVYKVMNNYSAYRQLYDENLVPKQ